MTRFMKPQKGAPVLHRFTGGAASTDTTTSRTISFVFATPGAVRGDDHQLLRGAWSKNWTGAGRDGLTSFRRNPVILEAHDATRRAVGKCANITETADGRLLGSIEFAETEDGDELLELYRSGAMSACSIGWVPVAATRANDPNRVGGFDVSKAELLEISLVAVPADENALVVGRSMTRTGDRAERVRLYAAATGRPEPFRTFGEQLVAVARHASGERDNRLVRAAGENDPSTGGFLVAEQFVDSLIGSIYEESQIAPLCDRRETSGPLASVKLPAIDEKSRADGSRWGGSLAYWAAEAASVTGSYPRFRQLEFNAKKLIAISIASGELAGDAPMLEAHLRRAFASETGFKLDAAVLSGSGAGVPLGILGAPATITVAKSSGQAPATIVGENIKSMWSRLPSPCRKRAVWLVNEDAMAQLDDGAAFSGIFQPAGVGGSASPLLKGRPVLEIEQAPALGTLGDIVLADLSQYIVVDGGVKAALSVDAYFVSEQLAFRFVLRVDGMPAWASPVTAYNGSGTRSPFVALAAR